VYILRVEAIERQKTGVEHAEINGITEGCVESTGEDSRGIPTGLLSTAHLVPSSLWLSYAARMPNRTPPARHPPRPMHQPSGTAYHLQ
jgi:hypothetical protein